MKFSVTESLQQPRYDDWRSTRSRFANMCVGSRPTLEMHDAKDKMRCTMRSHTKFTMEATLSITKDVILQSSGYRKSRIAAASRSNPRRVWQTMNTLLGEKKSHISTTFSANTYQDYMIQKINVSQTCHHWQVNQLSQTSTVTSVLMNFGPLHWMIFGETIKDSPSKQLADMDCCSRSACQLWDLASPIS